MSEKFEVKGNVNIQGEVSAEGKGAGGKRPGGKSLEDIIKEQIAKRGERRPGETPEQHEKRLQEDELGLKYSPESDNPPGAERISETPAEDTPGKDLEQARQEADAAFEK